MKKIKSKPEFFLDSGAYSANTRGVKIALQDYIDYIKKHNHLIDHYANLDDISSPVKTWKNQREMERQGLKPIPVYHVGEDYKYFDWVREYDYFALGGMANVVDKQTRSQWFDKLFTIICPKTNDYLPTHKVHGFGMTNFAIMERYPWYSVDSMSYLFTGRTGEIFVPRRHRGEFVYDAKLHRVNVSSVSKLSGEPSIYNRSPLIYKYFIDYFEENGFRLGDSDIKLVPSNYVLQEGERWISNRMGSNRNDAIKRVETINEPGLCNDYKQRDALNILFMKNFGDSLPKYPWKFKLNVGRFDL